MTTVLAIQHDLSWSWGNAIGSLIQALPDYRFVQIYRTGQECSRCGKWVGWLLSNDLQEHFDLILTQNHDGVRYLNSIYRNKLVARFGGLPMPVSLDPSKYAEDFKNVGAVVATNELLASFARPANSHTTVIPNGVDLDHFKPRPDFPGRPQRPFTIGFAGNITGMGARYKGWKHFVQAGVNLGADGICMKSVLFGVSQIPHDDMPDKFYHQIDTLILPSQGEGCSNVVTEALACGVPVICTKVGFHGEKLVDYENVVYITRDPETDSPETTDQICTAVRRLMREPDLYEKLSRNGRAFAVEHHDVTRVAAQYRAVFEDVLRRNFEARERQVANECAGLQQANGPGDTGRGQHLDQRG